MDPKQGEIYWVNIPAEHTEGSEQFGRRPFVVMSRDGLNRVTKTIVVVPLTTFDGSLTPDKLANQPPFRIAIPLAEITRDVSYTGVLSLCVAKTDQVRVISKTRLQAKVGRLSQTAVIAVGSGLGFVFAIR
jgi:mRNA-degrading endonuclease toxin of MazEF toxin-antitoxin module